MHPGQTHRTAMGKPAKSIGSTARMFLRAAGRRRWLVLGVSTVVFLACAAGAQFVPERYEASARIFVDTDTVLKPLMSGLTYQPDIDQQMRMLARTLVSRSNIEKLIATPG